MANPEHLKILKQGVEAWKAWRKEQKSNIIDLSEANFNGANLSGVNFSYADLTCSKFNGTDLTSADFTGADLCGMELIRANLRRANFVRAKLNAANFSCANLTGAILINATCYYVDFSDAEITDARLLGANLNNTKLNKTNLKGTVIGLTTFADVDLRGVAEIEKVVHDSPSTVGIDTLFKSQGQIPDKFLRDAGVPEVVIDIARSIRNGPPIQWHSCFISYSTKDDEFARRLHSRMREANMRVWFAPEDLKGGEKLHEQLFKAIQIQDRLLVVLSENSIQSEWVMTEIRKAREVEKKEKRRKLFPIRLTDFETLRNWTCFDADTGKDLAVEVREYFIPDFSNWKDHDSFESAFARLKKDLEAENSKK